MGGMGGMGQQMGGMGGMGQRMGGRFGGFGFDEPRARRASAGDFSEPQGRRAKPALVAHELAMSLEELYSGCVKKFKVTRHRSGSPESTVHEITVRPGWKAGTKLTFPSAGDDSGPGTPAGDLQFVIVQKPNQRFERRGDDLEATVRATLKDVVSGQPIEVWHLDKTQPPLRAKLSEVQLEKGRQVIRFPGRGMPVSTQNRKTKGSRPGDAVLVVEIAIPKTLSDAQRSAICAALD
ncbi:hypothetical protein T492DRAFT_1094146, partial [Pavlovales sp. CCMP2436]